LHALRGQGGANAATVDQDGVVLGGTTDLAEDWSAGLAFAHARTQTQTDAQSIQGHSTGLYALGLFRRQDWRIDAVLGAGRLTQDSTRHLDPTGLVASGSTHGWYGSASITARYHQGLGDKGFVEPYAGAAYLYSQLQAFSEMGAGVLNLDYADQSSRLRRFSAGVKTGLNWVGANGWQFKPWVSAGVAAYVGDTTTTQSLTLGVLDQSLNARGAPTAALASGAGVTFQSAGNRWRATLAYEGQHSRDSHFNSAQLKVSYRW
jgi:hypothetical protein